MKKVILILPFILLIIFESCEDNFNINAPYEDIYTLNCILRNDSPVQYAIISKNVYTENGNPPAQSNIAQNIRGANIKIFYNDSVFIMRDTTIQLADSGNIVQVNCYYLENLSIQPGNVISIEADMPDGQILKSKTKVPDISYSFLPYFPQYWPGYPGYDLVTEYVWHFSDKKVVAKNILNIPKLEIYYEKYEGGIYIKKKTSVPLSYYSYVYENMMLLYPGVELSFNNKCYTTFENVNKTMNEISGDDPNKSNYKITDVSFNVYGLDANLSRFCSAYNIYMESFTIKLRQIDYSNIEGGKGIFGVVYKFSRPLVVNHLYVQAFGYR